MGDIEDILASLPASLTADGRLTYGEFEIEKQIGSGGVGVVFLAQKKGEDRPVALKILSPEVAGSRDNVARFLREAQFMSSLEHTNLVDAYEVGMVELSFYLSMEYVPGRDLFEYLGDDGFIEPGEALGFMRQIAQALDYGVQRGIIHRDVKPENILISEDGVAKLTDLGLALLVGKEEFHLTVPGTIVGTPWYISPEQARAERHVDHRSDIYSLGCTFYHAICGMPPHLGGMNPVLIYQQHMNDTPRLPSACVKGLDPEIDALLMKCMAKKPEDRFQSYDDLMEAIDNTFGSCCFPKEHVVPDNIEEAVKRRSSRRMQRLHNAFSFEDPE